MQRLLDTADSFPTPVGASLLALFPRLVIPDEPPVTFSH